MIEIYLGHAFMPLRGNLSVRKFTKNTDTGHCNDRCQPSRFCYRKRR